MEELTADLTGKSKLAYEASLKIQQGLKLWHEGHLELEHLFGADKKAPKTIAHRTARIPRASLFKKDTRTDEEIRHQILEFIGDGVKSQNDIELKMKMATRSLRRALRALKKEGVLRHLHKGPRSPHEWSKNSTPKPKKAGKTTFIDHTQYVEKAIDYLKTHEWVMLKHLQKALNLSPTPLGRLIKYMTEKKIAKVVEKKNNPKHEREPRAYANSFKYVELL